MFGSTITERAAARSTAATSSAADGFSDCPPSTICVAPELSKSERLPAPATTATTSVTSGGASGTACNRRSSSPLGLLVHVRDLDLLERADGGSERERRTRLVGVHVHLQCGRIAYDEQRIPERLELLLERRAVEPGALDDEDGAVAVARELLVNGVEVQRLLDRRVRNRLARHDGRDAADDLEQAGPAGVDDARGTKDVEQLRRALDRVRTAQHDCCDQLAHRAVRMRLRLLRHLADDRQHRALDRLRHRRVGRIARAPESARQRCGIELLGIGDRLGEAADDLREDDAGVAARAHQRGARHFLPERREIRCVGRLDLLDRVANGERQVRAGVAVRYGVDVQIVEPAPVALEREQRAARKLARSIDVAHASIVAQSAAHFARRRPDGPLRRRVHGACCESLSAHGRKRGRALLPAPPHSRSRDTSKKQRPEWPPPLGTRAGGAPARSYRRKCEAFPAKQADR